MTLRPYQLDAEAWVRERAVAATALSFTIADARDPDHPLVYVNPAFTSTTGYSADDALGRNCRFLQAPGGDLAAAEMIRLALGKQEEVRVTLLNFRKDGSSFWNAVAIGPVYDPDGQLTHFVGIQTDVSAHVEADAERDRALQAERAALRRAERLHGGLALLAGASSQLALSFDVEDSLRRLAGLVVPAFADWVVIHQVDAEGNLSTAPIVRDRDDRRQLTDRYADLLPRSLTPHSPVYGLIADGKGWLLSEFDAAQALSWSTGADLAAVRDLLGVASSIFVALPGRQGVVGTMVLNRGPDSQRFTTEDLQVAIDLGRRAGLTIDNARLFADEHKVAETLQRSLLPTLPEIEGLDIAARYRPAASDHHVGGDFYDVLALPDGSTAVVIGDVVGHDLAAAVAMGHLRGVIRAVAWDSGADPTPDSVLHRVDGVVRGMSAVPLATMGYARLERVGPGQPLLLRHASAGHPPMLVRSVDGKARYLPHTPGLLLGVQAAERATSTATMDVGDTLIAFTDGLVERRGEDLDVGLERLRVLTQEAPSRMSADDLSHYLLDRVERGDDDSALLVVRRV